MKLQRLRLVHRYLSAAIAGPSRRAGSHCDIHSHATLPTAPPSSFTSPSIATVASESETAVAAINNKSATVAASTISYADGGFTFLERSLNTHFHIKQSSRVAQQQQHASPSPSRSTNTGTVAGHTSTSTSTGSIATAARPLTPTVQIDNRSLSLLFTQAVDQGLYTVALEHCMALIRIFPLAQSLKSKKTVDAAPSQRTSTLEELVPPSFFARLVVGLHALNENSNVIKLVDAVTARDNAYSSIDETNAAEVGRAYIAACQAGEQQQQRTKSHKRSEDYWLKAKSMVYLLASLEATDVSCFEAAIELCAQQGKWRTSIDLLKLMHSNGMLLTPAVGKSIIIVCAKESNPTAVQAALSLFNRMVQSGLPRDTAMYVQLLNGLIRTQKFEEAEKVWKQAVSDVGSSLLPNPSEQKASTVAEPKGKAPLAVNDSSLQKDVLLTDVMYASYIDILCHKKQFHKARELLSKLLKAMKKPHHSFNALYRGYMNDPSKVKDVESLILQGRKHKMGFSSHHLHSNINAMMNLRLYSPLVIFLEDYCTTPAAASLISAEIWQSIFNRLLEQGMVEEGVRLLNIARGEPSPAEGCGPFDEGSETVMEGGSEGRHTTAEYSKDAAKPNSKDQHPPTVPRKDVNTHAWVLRLISEMGRRGMWREALEIAERETRPWPEDLQNRVLEVLCASDHHDLALEKFKSNYRIVSEVDSSEEGDPSNDETVVRLNPIPVTAAESFMTSLAKNKQWSVIFEVLGLVWESYAEALQQHENDGDLEPDDSEDCRLGIENCVTGNDINNFHGMEDVEEEEELDMLDLIDDREKIMHEMYTHLAKLAFQGLLSGGGNSSSDVVKKLLAHHKDLGITPLWSTVRLAMKTMYREGDFKGVLTCFTDREQAHDYKAGDERIYEYAITAAGALGKGSKAITAILGELLKEKARPAPGVFETAMRVLSENMLNSSIFEMTEIHSIMKERKIRPSSQTYALLITRVPPHVQSQLLREAVKLGISVKNIQLSADWTESPVAI